MNDPISQLIPNVAADAVAWRDVARWAAVVVPIAGFAFWFGVQLTGISGAIAAVQSDVSEIKASVRVHSALPAHPIANERIRQLERAAAKVVGR